MSNSNTKKVFVGNRVIGEVTDGAFRKRIQGSKHILHTPRAIALSVDSLEQAKRFCAEHIEITDAESGIVYSCSFEHFMRYSFEMRRGGFELQRTLVIEKWDVTSPLSISSHAPKRGEVKRKPGNGQRIRNKKTSMRRMESPRQLMFKGML